MLKSDTKVFFVVDSAEDNPEIFQSYGEAIKWVDILKASKCKQISLKLQFINNAYFDNVLNAWNYEDLSDTFGEIITTYATHSIT